MFIKSTLIGRAAYANLQTGEEKHTDEHIVLINETDEDGAWKPYYKAAYVSNGDVVLKLSFQATKDSWAVRDQTGVVTFDCQFEIPVDNSVGRLRHPFDVDGAGSISTYGPTPWKQFNSWRYRDIHGHPVHPVFRGQPGGNYFIEGWGHRVDGKLVRTMLYKTQRGADLVNVYLKSSTLEWRTGPCQVEPFETFV